MAYGHGPRHHCLLAPHLVGWEWVWPLPQPNPPPYLSLPIQAPPLAPPHPRQCNALHAEGLQWLHPLRDRRPVTMETLWRCSCQAPPLSPQRPPGPAPYLPPPLGQPFHWPTPHAWQGHGQPPGLQLFLLQASWGLGVPGAHKQGARRAGWGRLLDISFPFEAPVPAEMEEAFPPLLVHRGQGVGGAWSKPTAPWGPGEAVGETEASEKLGGADRAPPTPPASHLALSTRTRLPKNSSRPSSSRGAAPFSCCWGSGVPGVRAYGEKVEGQGRRMGFCHFKIDSSPTLLAKQKVWPVWLLGLPSLEGLLFQDPPTLKMTPPSF